MAREAEMLVEVELSAERFGLEARQLGSLTERYGMRMDVVRPLTGRARTASIAVPRAKTQREAEATVAALIARIRLRVPR
jgi:hypothetical protein